jgi:hypothetical protein
MRLALLSPLVGVILLSWKLRRDRYHASASRIYWMAAWFKFTEYPCWRALGAAPLSSEHIFYTSLLADSKGTTTEIFRKNCGRLGWLDHYRRSLGDHSGPISANLHGQCFCLKTI